MEKINYRIQDYPQATLNHQADDLVQRKMTRLLWNKVDLMSAEVEVGSIGELQELARCLCYTCNRVVILGMQSEFTHLVIAKSSDIAYLYVDEILAPLAQDYSGQSYGDQTLAHAKFYQYDIIPDLIDSVVQSVIIALPYKH